MLSGFRNKLNKVAPAPQELLDKAKERVEDTTAAVAEAFDPEIEGYEDMTEEEKKTAKIAKAARLGGKAMGAYAEAQQFAQSKTAVVMEQAQGLAAQAGEAAYDKLSDEQKAELKVKIDEGKQAGQAAMKKTAAAAKDVALEVKAGYAEGKALADRAAEQAWNDLPEDVKEGILERKRKATEWKENLKAEALELAGPAIDMALDVARVKVIEAATNDNDMPNAVVKTIDFGVSSIWPDIVIEIKDKLAGAIRKATPVDEGEPPEGCWHGLVAWLRYHYKPYNLSSWGLMRRPGYWLIYLVMALPVFGVRSFCFMLILLLIDRKDEYQLLSFIMSFKGFQFISGGIIQAILGAVLYYSCINFNQAGDLAEVTCVDSGPGAADNFFLSIIAFLLNVVLVWIAFAFIGSSVKKGEKTYIGASNKEKDEKAEGVDSSGREEVSRLRKLLLWDMFWFLIAAVVVVFFFITFDYYDPEDDSVEPEPLTNPFEVFQNWRFRAHIYWIKVFYSFMTFPFMLWSLPVLSSLVSHAKPTGYSPNGHCIAMVPPPPRDRTKDEEQEDVENDKTK